MVVSNNNPAVQAGNVALAAVGAVRPKGVLRTKVKTRELVQLTSQLAIMTRAGVDMASALQSLIRQSKSPALRSVLEEVHQEVLSGNTVSQSMAQFSRVFDGTYVASIAAGEASGRLAEVLAQLASMLRSEVRLQSSVKTMLILTR